MFRHGTSFSAVRFRVYAALLGLLLGIIRLLPDIWIGQTPIGNDSSAAYMDAYYHYHGSFLQSITHFNLYYYFLHLANIVHIDSFIAVKASGIIFYLLLACSFFWLLRLLFPQRSSALVLLGTVLFASQIGVLRISWDLFRNELGLIGLIITLASAIKIYEKNPRYYIGVITGALLTLASHQLCTLVLIQVFMAIFCVWLSGKISFLRSRRWLPFVIWIPLWLYFAKFIAQPGGVTLRETLDVVSQSLVHLEGLLFIILFIPLAPLALWGAIKHQFARPAFRTVILSLTLLLLIQSLIGLIIPTITFSHADRWIFFLTIPLGILAFGGLVELQKPYFITFFLGFWVIVQGFISFCFWSPHLSLYRIKSIDPRIYNVFPARMVSNSLIASSYDQTLISTLPECASELQLIFPPTDTFYLEYRYFGIANHYFPEAMIANSRQVDTVPSTLPGESYAFGYDLHPASSWQQINGDTCPIYYYLPHPSRK